MTEFANNETGKVKLEPIPYVKQIYNDPTAVDWDNGTSYSTTATCNVVKRGIISFTWYSSSAGYLYMNINGENRFTFRNQNNRNNYGSMEVPVQPGDVVKFTGTTAGFSYKFYPFVLQYED